MAPQAPITRNVFMEYVILCRAHAALLFAHAERLYTNRTKECVKPRRPQVYRLLDIKGIRCLLILGVLSSNLILETKLSVVSWDSRSFDQHGRCPELAFCHEVIVLLPAAAAVAGG